MDSRLQCNLVSEITQAQLFKITQWRVLLGLYWAVWSWLFLEFFYLRLSTAKEKHKMQPGGKQWRQQYTAQNSGTMTTVHGESYKLMWFWRQIWAQVVGTELGVLREVTWYFGSMEMSRLFLKRTILLMEDTFPQNFSDWSLLFSSLCIPKVLIFYYFSM